MKDGEREEWIRETLERIRRHRRRMFSGMIAMLDDGMIAVLDALAVAPLLVAEETGEGAAEFEERRSAKLEEVAASAGDARQHSKEGDFPARGGTLTGKGHIAPPATPETGKSAL